jgi:hypothetical protein
MRHLPYFQQDASGPRLRSLTKCPIYNKMETACGIARHFKIGFVDSKPVLRFVPRDLSFFLFALDSVCRSHLWWQVRSGGSGSGQGRARGRSDNGRGSVSAARIPCHLRRLIIGLDAPHVTVLEVIDQLLILGRSHIASPYDLSTVNVGLVVYPLLARRVIGRASRSRAAFLRNARVGRRPEPGVCLCLLVRKSALTCYPVAD